MRRRGLTSHGWQAGTPMTTGEQAKALRAIRRIHELPTPSPADEAEALRQIAEATARSTEDPTPARRIH